MRRVAPVLLGFLVLSPASAPAQTEPAVQATYEMYADGLHVAEVEATLSIGAHRYSMQVAYHTTGLISMFRRGHQQSSVVGVWQDGRPDPRWFSAAGVWNGEDNATLINYRNDEPQIEQLVPTTAADKREPVPPAMQRGTVDSLSALALLMRRVQQTGRCDAAVRTFDGRRASDVSAHTVDQEVLGASNLSMFAGPTLRCDFVGKMIAGFLFRDDTPADRQPLHGSAWLATLLPGVPPLPVRMDFQTRWFGEADMYLTHLAPAPPTEVAAH